MIGGKFKTAFGVSRQKTLHAEREHVYMKAVFITVIPDAN